MEMKGDEALLDQQASFGSVVSNSGTICFIEKVMGQPGAKRSISRPILEHTAEEGPGTSSSKPRPVEHSELTSHGVIHFTGE